MTAEAATSSSLAASSQAASQHERSFRYEKKKRTTNGRKETPLKRLGSRALGISGSIFTSRQLVSNHRRHLCASDYLTVQGAGVPSPIQFPVPRLPERRQEQSGGPHDD